MRKILMLSVLTGVSLAARASAAGTASDRRELEARQIQEREGLSEQQRARLDKLRRTLDQDEADFRRRESWDRRDFVERQRQERRAFDASIKGGDRLAEKEARRSLARKQELERKQFDAEQRRKRLEFYAGQRESLKYLRKLDDEQKRQLSSDQRAARAGD